MLKVSRPVEYALIALKHMSQTQSDQVTTVREVCETYLVPFDVTSRALQRLSREGIVQSERGTGGGYRIVRDLAEVSLYDLMETVDGPLHLVVCLDTPHKCHLCRLDRCNIILPMVSLNARLESFMRRVSILELIEDKVTEDGHENRLTHAFTVRQPSQAGS